MLEKLTQGNMAVYLESLIKVYGIKACSYIYGVAKSRTRLSN